MEVELTLDLVKNHEKNSRNHHNMRIRENKRQAYSLKVVGLH